MPKKKKKRDKGGDGMTLAQRIEAMKKEKEEAATRQATVEEVQAPPEQELIQEEPTVEMVAGETQQSQEEGEPQKAEEGFQDQGQMLQKDFIPAEFNASAEDFFIQTKDGNLNLDFSRLPPAMFLPEQSYISRRAYQMFGKYHDYIDPIDKVLDHTLSNIIESNSTSPELQVNTGDQSISPDDTQIRALIRYLLSDTMQMEMDRFLADV